MHNLTIIVIIGVMIFLSSLLFSQANIYQTQVDNLLNSYGFTEIKYENKKPFTCPQQLEKTIHNYFFFFV
jgi:hypothetical protein